MPGLLVFPLMMLDCAVVNGFVFTLASRVNTTSTEMLKMQERHSIQFGGRRSVLAREIRSCGVLKIKFGSNYVDKGTPLVIQDFCVNQTLNLLLIDEGH